MTQRTKENRLALMRAEAEQVFATKEDSEKWINRKIRSLGGVTAMSLSETESGFELVMKTLGRIKYGVVS